MTIGRISLLSVLAKEISLLIPSFLHACFKADAGQVRAWSFAHFQPKAPAA